MDTVLQKIKSDIYDKISLNFSDFKIDNESKDYKACQYQLNQSICISRNSKITPKKTGQFVTFWKRFTNQPIEPFSQSDLFDYYVVNVTYEKKIGQFIFPKSILIQKGIVSTKQKEGKRAFRVYPNWDIPTSKQAKKTQQWQLNYFYEINKNLNFNKVLNLYNR